MYQIFQNFDQDGDGYMSYADFDAYLKKIKVFANEKETASMLKLLDQKGNGYLSFHDFSQVFCPEMSENLVKVQQNDTYYPNLFPSKEILKKNLDCQDKVQQSIKEIRKGFQPDFDSSKFASINICRTRSTHQIQRKA